MQARCFAVLHAASSPASSPFHAADEEEEEEVERVVEGVGSITASPSKVGSRLCPLVPGAAHSGLPPLRGAPGPFTPGCGMALCSSAACGALDSFGLVAGDSSSVAQDRDEVAAELDASTTPATDELVASEHADEAILWVRAWLLLVIGVVQLAAVRFCVQAFLDQAVVSWYEFRHDKHGVTGLDVNCHCIGGTDSKGGQEEAKIVGQRIESVKLVVGKVAMQTTAPACLIMQSAVCSLLALQAKESAASSTSQAPDLLPVELWLCISTFLGAFSTLVWGVVTAITVSFLRTGQMK
eukprot:scaffold1847_cov343-Prasinococcus_capsulatus_cf.AAC.11